MKSLLPEPRFLNLEYLFDQILALLRFLLWLFEKIIIFLLNLDVKAFFFALAALTVVFMGVIARRLVKLNRKKNIRSSIKFKDEELVPGGRSGKWKEINKKMESAKQEDWKTAIVMADAIMDDIFASIGFKEEGLGEKLKNVEPSDFDSLQAVWDGYKTRVRIDKEGVSFSITKEEAKETLAKYEKGLKELKYL